MATVAITSNQLLADIPLYIRKLTVTGGTTAAALTHGGPARVPDIAFAQASTTAPDNIMSLYSATTTTITADTEVDDGNDTFEVYLIWFTTGVGGISA